MLHMCDVVTTDITYTLTLTALSTLNLCDDVTTYIANTLTGAMLLQVHDVHPPSV